MRLAKSVKFREEKFGGVLFETRSEKVFTLNPTAAAVVREIQAGRPEHEIGRASGRALRRGRGRHRTGGGEPSSPTLRQQGLTDE